MSPVTCFCIILKEKGVACDMNKTVDLFFNRHQFENRGAQITSDTRQLLHWYQSDLFYLLVLIRIYD